VASGAKTGHRLSAWQGVEWPVAPLELLTAESPDLDRVAGSAVPLKELRRALTEVGGVLRVPRVLGLNPPAVRSWHLADRNKAEEFTREACNVRVKDAGEVIRFVQKWGALDVVGADIPLMARPKRPPEIVATFPFDDTLRETREVLAQAQDIVSQLSSLGRSRKHESQWWALTERIEPWLSAVHPTIRWDADKGPLPTWTVQRPVEVLFITLWDWATSGGRLKRCRYCGAWFVGSDPRKKYCTIACTNRASAAATYKRRRDAATRGGRRKR
jgi:hypothetical protein